MGTVTNNDPVQNDPNLYERLRSSCVDHLTGKAENYRITRVAKWGIRTTGTLFGAFAAPFTLGASGWVTVDCIEQKGWNKQATDLRSSRETPYARFRTYCVEKLNSKEENWRITKLSKAALRGALLFIATAGALPSFGLSLAIAYDFIEEKGRQNYIRHQLSLQKKNTPASPTLPVNHVTIAHESHKKRKKSNPADTENLLKKSKEIAALRNQISNLEVEQKRLLEELNKPPKVIFDHSREAALNSQIQQLTDELDRQKQELNRFEKLEESLNREIQKLKAEQSRDFLKIDELNRNLQNAESLVKVYLLELQNKKNEINALEANKLMLLDSIDNSNLAIISKANKIAQLEAVLAHEREQIEEDEIAQFSLQKKINTLNELLRQVQRERDDLTAINTGLSLQLQAKTTLLKNISDQKEKLENVDDQKLLDFQQQLEDVSKAKLTIEDGLQKKEEELAALNKLLQGVQEELKNRTGEYIQLNASFNELDYEHSSLKAKIQDKENEIISLTNKLSANDNIIDEDLQGKEKAIQDLFNAKQVTEQELKALNETVIELSKKLEAAQEEITSKTDSIKLLSEQLKPLQAFNQHAEEQLARHSQENQALENRLSELKSSYKDLNESNNNTNDINIRIANEKHDALKSLLEKNQEELNSKTQAYEELSQKADELQKFKQQLTKLAQAQKTEIDKAYAARNEAATWQKAAETALRQKNLEMQQIQEQLTESQKKVFETKIAFEVADENASDLKTKLRKVKDKKLELKNSIETLSHEVEELKKFKELLLTSASSNALQGNMAVQELETRLGVLTQEKIKFEKELKSKQNDLDLAATTTRKQNQKIEDYEIQLKLSAEEIEQLKKDRRDEDNLSVYRGKRILELEKQLKLANEKLKLTDPRRLNANLRAFRNKAIQRKNNQSSENIISQVPDNDQLSKEIENLKQKYEQQEREYQHLNSSYDYFVNHNQTLTENILRLENEKITFETTLKTQEKEAQKAQEQFKGKIAEQERQLEDYNVQLKNLSEEVNTLKASKDLFQQQASKLGNEKKELTSENARLQRDLGAYKNKENAALFDRPPAKPENETQFISLQDIDLIKQHKINRIAALEDKKDIYHQQLQKMNANAKSEIDRNINKFTKQIDCYNRLQNNIEKYGAKYGIVISDQTAPEYYTAQTEILKAKFCNILDLKFSNNNIVINAINNKLESLNEKIGILENEIAQQELTAETHAINLQSWYQDANAVWYELVKEQITSLHKARQIEDSDKWLTTSMISHPGDLTPSNIPVPPPPPPKFQPSTQNKENPSGNEEKAETFDPNQLKNIKLKPAPPSVPNNNKIVSKREEILEQIRDANSINNLRKIIQIDYETMTQGEVDEQFNNETWKKLPERAIIVLRRRGLLRAEHKKKVEKASNNDGDSNYIAMLTGALSNIARAWSDQMDDDPNDECEFDD